MIETDTQGNFTGGRRMLLGSKVEAIYLEQDTFII